MFFPGKSVQVYLATSATDMRKSIDSLSILVTDRLELDLFSGYLFCFCNRKKDMVKILYWDRNDFCLWFKRLEKDRFRWPQSEEEVMTTDGRQLSWLLEGFVAESSQKSSAIILCDCRIKKAGVNSLLSCNIIYYVMYSAMIIDIATLPDDRVQLKQMLVDFQVQFDKETGILLEQIRLLRSQLYGRKSEKARQEGGPQPLPLFDMPEPSFGHEKEEEIIVPAHTRKKKGRKPLPENLPRVERVHDLDPSEKICACGNELSLIGEEVSERLKIIPANIQVIRNVRPKYACRKCEGVDDKGPTVKIAPVPAQIIPKSIATPGLLAHILTGKFYRPHNFLSPREAFSSPWCRIIPDNHVQMGDTGCYYLSTLAEFAHRRGFSRFIYKHRRDNLTGSSGTRPGSDDQIVYVGLPAWRPGKTGSYLPISSDSEWRCCSRIPL